MNSVKLQDTRSTHKIQFYFYILVMYNSKTIKTTIQFIIALKRIKYLSIHLTKQMKGIYSEHNKIFLKEVKEDPNKWREITYS